MSSTNRVLAAPSHCCFTGFKHEGTPAGTKITIANVPTYLSEPPKKSNSTTSDRIILFLPDAYGVFYQNNMLVQDFLAQNGFTVLGIDYFMGDAVHLHTESDFDPLKWVEAIRKVADEVTPKWLAGVKDKYGKEPKYCVAGYCFGAPYMMDLAADQDVVAVSLAHPGLLNEDHFRNLNKPLMLSCAENDFTFPLQSRRIAEDILIERNARYYIQIFSGVQHGFAARGDPSSSDIRWGKEQSAKGVAMWFHRFLDERKLA